MPEEQITHPWLSQYVGAIIAKGSLSELGITIDPMEGVSLSDQTTDDGIRKALITFADIRDKNRVIMLMMDRYMGQLVVAYADKHDCDWASAISDLDLEGFTGKSLSSLRKLPRIAATVPDEMFMLPHVTTTQMDTVTSFSGPIEDYNKMLSFNEKRWDLLRKASETPEDWPKARMANEMRKIQMEHGVLPKRAAPISYTVEQFMKTSIMLVSFTEADWEAVGTTRGEALTHWESYQNELINRGRIEASSSNPHDFTLPWAVTDEDLEPEPIEVEATPEEVPE